jgi:hypothetical protein
VSRGYDKEIGTSYFERATKAPTLFWILLTKQSLSPQRSARIAEAAKRRWVAQKANKKAKA